MKISLEGKVALVTGGSRGIGRTICQRLADAGAYILVNYVDMGQNKADAEETLRLCGGAEHGELIGFDVSNSEQVEVAFDQVKVKPGKIDILVNNAGISIDQLVIRMKDEDWRRTLSINLDGAFYCSRAAAKLMFKARSGTIVNISSVVGEKGNPGQVAYSSSKAGLIGLTKTLARELAARNITVNAVAPGYIDTDMTKALPQEVKDHYLKEIPLARMGTPEDIAACVVFLASSQAGYITGQILGVNGGYYT